MLKSNLLTSGVYMLQPLVDGSRIPPSPERRLLIAILEDAINCFEKYYLMRHRHGNRLFREAEEWIMSQSDRGPFSFEYICAVLGLDAEAVRGRLRREVSARHSFTPTSPSSAGAS